MQKKSGGDFMNGIQNIIISKKDNNTSLLDQCLSVTVKVVRLLRGYFKKNLFKKSGKKIFIGKGTSIKHCRNMIIGNNVTINDYVEINAESQNSVVIGNNITIGKYSIIKCTGKYKNVKTGIKIGDNSSFGDFCFFGCAGGILIGNDVIMGQNIRFHAQNHNFDKVDILIKDQGTTQEGITIENNCWIGGGTVFLDGVTIGTGSIIGANSLVNKNIPEHCVAVGNPIKIIKKYDKVNKVWNKVSK